MFMDISEKTGIGKKKNAVDTVVLTFNKIHY